MGLSSNDFNIIMAEGVGFEPTEGYKPPPVFKTGAFSQLDHPSSLRFCYTIA